MVDIHCHILWGVDDGAKSFDESLAMARMAADRGTTDVVATPHRNDLYPFDEELVGARLAELRAACGDRPRIHLGSDFHLNFSNLEAAFVDARPFTINRLKYLLVELPASVIPFNCGKAFERLLNQGIRPVITHPERNRPLWKEEHQFESWLDAGCYTQITAQSLDGFFGKTARGIAWRLLETDRVHFIASDGHDPENRPPRLDRAFEAVSGKYGKDVALMLFRDNPTCAIKGLNLPDSMPKRKPRSRFRLFGL